MKNCIIVKTSFVYNDEGYDQEEGVEVIPTLYTKEEAKKEIESKFTNIESFKHYLPYNISKDDVDIDRLVELGCTLPNAEKRTYGKTTYITYQTEDIIFPKNNVKEILECFDLEIYKIIELK